MYEGCCEYPRTRILADLNVKSSMNIRHCRSWIAIFFFFYLFLTETRSFHNSPLKFFTMTMVLLDNISNSNTFVSCRLVKILKVFQNPLVIYSNLFCLNTLHLNIINSAKNIIKCQLSNKFQRFLFFFELFFLPTR